MIPSEDINASHVMDGTLQDFGTCTQEWQNVDLQIDAQGDAAAIGSVWTVYETLIDPLSLIAVTLPARDAMGKNATFTLQKTTPIRAFVGLQLRGIASLKAVGHSSVAVKSTLIGYGTQS